MIYHYLVLIGLGTFKFMFAPVYGLANHLSFFESYIFTVIGGILSAITFYWPAEYFMSRAAKKRKEKLIWAEQNGKTIVMKKKFTRRNKAVVKVKTTLGIWGISLFVPLFLSVPAGSIITAKFYGKDRRTFYIILLGLGINGLFFTTLFYLFS